ncbi:MAG: PfkB family carbohydrate kinase [Phycisphaerales bacterium]|nr:PfkB family carbohydrate kinase [Phycisphaerales bacterium]
MHSSRNQSSKIITLEQMLAKREELSIAGYSLVHCHGCFDIVHPGHIQHLKFAAAQGDRLVVSVTADEFVNKGTDRPMFGHNLRAENIAALEFVEWVCIHHQETAVDLLDQIKPDIYIKGAEYAQKRDPRFDQEREVVELNGGRVVFSSGDIVFSSSAIVDSIRNSSRSDPGVGQIKALSNQNDFSSSRVAQMLERAKGKRVLVVGETILDTYVQCQWPEIAEEHPILSLRPTSSKQYDGGAAIIAKHLHSLGASVTLATPVCSEEWIERVEHDGVQVFPIETKTELPEKIRYLVGREKVVKLDCTNRINLEQQQRSALINAISEEKFDAIVLADFGLGMLSDGFVKHVVESTKGRVECIVGDVSGTRSELLSMIGFDILCPCESEIRFAMRDQHSTLEDVARRFQEHNKVRWLFVTLGQGGVMMLDESGHIVRLPALSNDPVDVLGCGDALLVGVSLSLLGGLNIVESGYVGSLTAAIEGASLGNVPVSNSQLLSKAQQLAAMYAHELSSEEAFQVIEKADSSRC